MCQFFVLPCILARAAACISLYSLLSSLVVANEMLGEFSSQFYYYFIIISIILGVFINIIIIIIMHSNIT